jgi:hypothetical protein
MTMNMAPGTGAELAVSTVMNTVMNTVYMQTVCHCSHLITKTIYLKLTLSAVRKYRLIIRQTLFLSSPVNSSRFRTFREP